MNTPSPPVVPQYETFLEDTAAYVLGAVDNVHINLRQIRSNIETHETFSSENEKEKILKEFAAMIWTSQHLPAALPMLTPPNAVKQRILDAIHADLPELASNTREIENEHTFQQTEQHSEFIPEFDPRGLSVYTIANDDSGWMPHPITGISVKPLASDKSRGYSTLLMRLASGTCFPSHSHSGAEQCFVVQGSINVLNKTLVSGDFLSTKAGADHGNITSTNGATVLLVVALEDYNKSAWKVLASSLFHRWKSVLNK